MAITANTVADGRARARLFMLFSALGIAAGMAAGWQAELNNLSPAGRALAPAFARGWAMEALELTTVPVLLKTGLADTYFLMVQEYPMAAASLAASIKKALVFPWPLIGWAAGMGGMVLLSKLNDFSNKRG